MGTRCDGLEVSRVEEGHNDFPLKTQLMTADKKKRFDVPHAAK